MNIYSYYMDRFYENKRNGKFVKITIAKIMASYQK
jgi:hypothetical protein